MKKVCLTVLGLCLAMAPLMANAAPIKVACGSENEIEWGLCKDGVAAWAKKTGNDATAIALPNGSTARLEYYRKVFANRADSPDVLYLDVVWPGMMAEHLIDLRPYLGDSERDYFPQILAGNIVKRKLVALPWFVDAGVLYYRKDLLQKYGIAPPKTWAELSAGARKIQDAERAVGQKKMWGFVWQGRAYEGLTCNALEWIASTNGGTIIDAKGRVTLNNPQAQKALEMARSWVGSISPPEVLDFDEGASLAAFQSGNAVFLRSWPYAQALVNGNDSAIKGKVGVVGLPSNVAWTAGVGTLGGWQLGVSKYSRNPQLAASLAVYLAGDSMQKERAIKGAYNPSIGHLYFDLDVVRAHPHFSDFFEAFSSIVTRPSTPTAARYGDVSKAFFTMVHDVLSGKLESRAAIVNLERSYNAMMIDGQWK